MLSNLKTKICVQLIMKVWYENGWRNVTLGSKTAMRPNNAQTCENRKLKLENRINRKSKTKNAGSAPARLSEIYWSVRDLLDKTYYYTNDVVIFIYGFKTNEFHLSFPEYTWFNPNNTQLWYKPIDKISILGGKTTCSTWTLFLQYFSTNIRQWPVLVAMFTLKQTNNIIWSLVFKHIW